MTIQGRTLCLPTSFDVTAEAQRLHPPAAPEGGTTPNLQTMIGHIPKHLSMKMENSGLGSEGVRRHNSNDD